MQDEFFFINHLSSIQFVSSELEFQEDLENLIWIDFVWRVSVLQNIL